LPGSRLPSTLRKKMNRTQPIAIPSFFGLLMLY
jgi:hypothetical protein